jgi:hypothetical protein
MFNVREAVRQLVVVDAVDGRSGDVVSHECAEAWSRSDETPLTQLRYSPCGRRPRHAERFADDAFGVDLRAGHKLAVLDLLSEVISDLQVLRHGWLERGIHIQERELRYQLERKDNHPLAQSDELLDVLAEMKERGLIEAEMCFRLTERGRALLAGPGASGRAGS